MNTDFCIEDGIVSNTDVSDLLFVLTFSSRKCHNVGYAHNPVNYYIRVIDYSGGLLNPGANILVITKYFAHIAQNI